MPLADLSWGFIFCFFSSYRNICRSYNTTMTRRRVPPRDEKALRFIEIYHHSSYNNTTYYMQIIQYINTKNTNKNT